MSEQFPTETNFLPQHVNLESKRIKTQQFAADVLCQARLRALRAALRKRPLRPWSPVVVQSPLKTNNCFKNTLTLKLKSEKSALETRQTKLLARVQKRGGYLRWIPPHLQTREIQLAAVRNDGRALRFIANQSEDVCLAAVRQYGKALKFVKSQTRDVVIAALRKDICAMQFVDMPLYDALEEV